MFIYFFILSDISKLSTQLSEISLMPKRVLSLDYCIFVSTIVGGREKWVKAMKLYCFHNIAQNWKVSKDMWGKSS